MKMLLLVTLVAIQGASAQLVIDNGPPILHQRGGQSDLSINRQRADDFAVTEQTAFASLEWFGGYWDNTVLFPDFFRMRLYSQSTQGVSRTPSIDIGLEQTTREVLGLADALTTYRYRAVFEQFTLQPDIYWLSIVNQTGQFRASLEGAWYWAPTSLSGGNALFRGPDVNPWIPDSFGDYDYSFRMLAIPEPSTMLVILLAIVGMLLVRRIKKA